MLPKETALKLLSTQLPLTAKLKLVIYLKALNLKYVVSILLSSLILITHNTAYAQIYHYVNDAGRKIYVDRLSQVPPKYKSQLRKKSVVETKIDPIQQHKYAIENAALAQKMAARNAKNKLLALSKQMKTKVQIYQNKVVVPVNISYVGQKKTVNLLLDTGASATVLNLNTLPNFDPESTRVSYAQVAGGGLIKTWQLSLNTLSFGPINFDDKKVLMIQHQGPSSTDGLLGMDVLSQLDYKINFRERHIIWNKDDFLKIQQQINQLDVLLK